ncbi:MAG: hypothetical protein U0Q12_02365 [Vicinamibacterales bacterium]
MPDVQKAMDAARLAGYAIVTRAEAPPTIEVKGDLAIVADQHTRIGYVMGARRDQGGSSSRTPA